MDSGNQLISNLLHENRTMYETLGEELKEAERELIDWENRREPQPVRSEAVLRNRQRLEEEGIPYQEFYKLLEFGSKLSEEECNHLEEALLQMGILDAIARELPPGTPVSLMRQYTPMNGVNLPGLDRRLTAREYARVRDYMLALGLEGYLQSRESADSAFTPAFMDGESTRLFPSERADAEN